MIIQKPVSQEQLDQKYLREDAQFQEQLNLGVDYVLTDLMTRLSALERKEETDDA